MAERDVNLSRKYEKQDELALRNAVQTLQATSEGRYFLRHLIELSGHGQDVPPGNAIETAYVNGRHSVGLEIIILLDLVDISIYPTLLLETREQARSRMSEYEQGNTR